MNISDAIQILRKHNISGASVLRITEGKVTEHELLDYVLNACDQFIAEREEYKRLLKAAVEDVRYCMRSYDPCEICALLGEDGECPATDDDDCGEKYKWQHEAEALALLGKDTNVPASADDTNVGGKIDSWISCKDRLPSENTLVLCYARSTTGEGNQYFLGAIAHREFWFLKVYDIGHVSHPVHYWEVTHWQPLSEPPKE